MAGLPRRHRAGTQRYELTLLYPVSEARVRDARIERIRDAYERTYAQDSVARVDERTTADF